MAEKEMTEIQNKVVRLFAYLEKALALDSNVIRDFKNITIAPSPWWLADMPHDAENLYVRQFETEDKLDESTPTDLLLRVEKKNISPAPPLPKELEEWINEITPLEAPRPKEKIDRKLCFDQDETRLKEFKKFLKDYKQGNQPPDSLKDWVVLGPGKLPEFLNEIYVEDYWRDHKELQKLLLGYTENEWEQWAKKVIKIYKANLIYDQLYALRLLLKNEGDNFELLLGHGLFTWKHKGVGEICSPIFLTPLTLDFDPSGRKIQISPDQMFRGFVEVSPLYEMDNPAEMDLITWSDKLNANPFDFWHLETLKLQARTLINYISNESEDRFDKEIVSSPQITRNPSVWNAPVIFARRRSNDLWSKYAGIIRRDIEQNNVEPNEFISDLVGESANIEIKNESDGEAAVPDVFINNSELLFPLPWNDEQKRIAERLDSNYGVVVKGPPGTGKSHTIANLISRFLSQGKTVLVTSQTSKALEVLRNKLPENIRSLAVSQLHQTANRDDVLQESISEISSNLGERHTKFSEKKADLIKKELHLVREEKSVIANKIREYILTDSSVKIVLEEESIKPIDASIFVSKYKDDPDCAWFTDEVPFDMELNFNEEEIKELFELLCELSPDEQKLNKFEFPPNSVLPNEGAVIGTFSIFRELSEKAEKSHKFLDTSNHQFVQEKLVALQEQLIDANKILSSINKDYEREIFDICITSQSEREKWGTVLSKLFSKIQLIGKSKNSTLGHEIKEIQPFSANDLLDGVHALKEKTSKNKKIGTFGKVLLSSNAKKVLENYLVDGKEPNNEQAIELLIHFANAKNAENEIRTLLDQSFFLLKSFSEIKKENLDLIQLEVFTKSFDRLVNYSRNYSSIEDFLKSNRQFSGFNYSRKDDVKKIIEIIESLIAKFEIKNLEKLFSGWILAIENSFSGPRHQAIERLLESIQKRNTSGWKSSTNELGLLISKRNQAIRLNELVEKIRRSVPNLFDDIVGLVGQKEQFNLPKNLKLVWKMARLESWLDKIHDHVSIDDLQNQMERLTKKELQLNSELITIMAWQSQIDKVTKKQRDALMAWSHEIKKYGKGTGKYAVTHLRAAQEALKEAKNAVPVWIMPLHRAAQMFSEPKAGMFDVVIFDEASQCDMRGINICYLGKKLLVVGDPEQISPAGIFQDQERIFELISRFLFDIPFKESFSITSSLFDLAKIRLSNIIQLNEHFRCVPEIIAFSNHHIYEGKLKPLRYPHPKGLLKPTLYPVFVKKGFQNFNNKVNEPEAEAIVSKLVECLRDPKYQKRPDGRPCTFGIISLLAEDQAKHIEKLIRNLIGKGVLTEKIMEERKIECGDAYKFQGDERDVIFLSMVRAHDPNKLEETISPLVDEGAKRRFNVAASRARDQMFLFHSIGLEDFTNKNDWRFKLLNWFYDPKTEDLSAGRDALKKEFDTGRASKFSYDVGNILINRGYQIFPEYPVIGYRIDLVVQGVEARLAVECDGDQYHTLENWEQDQMREEQLRRAGGWEFWRVTGSSFYRNKERALESLWKKLESLGIKPLIE